MTKILLVEDNLELVGIIRRELNTAGYEVVDCADGKTALELVERCRPDAILLDWMLPVLDGVEVLRRLQNDSRVCPPVLMLTARGEEADRVIGLEMGADDYLAKPFSMRELLARVKALLRRAEKIRQTLSDDQGGGEKPLVWRDLRVDPLAMRAEMNGAEIILTQIEFNLLMLFLRNPGRVFSRTYLLEVIWNQPYIEGDRSVDNAILRLRKKIHPAGDEIEAVWGVGYRLRKN